MKILFTQHQLVQDIQKNNESVLKKLYQDNYHKVQTYVLKNNGCIPMAKDLYQETFLAAWQNVKNGSFVPKNETALQGYIYQIAKNKWTDYLRSSRFKKTAALFKEDITESNDSSEENELLETKLNVVENNFKNLGEDCKNLLMDFYFNKKSLKEIAEGFDINEASARNKKYRCIQQLKALSNL